MSDNFSLTVSPSQLPQSSELAHSSDESQSSQQSEASQIVQIEDRFFWFRKAIFWAKACAMYQTTIELLEIDEKEVLKELRDHPNEALENNFVAVKAMQKRAKDNLKAANELLVQAKSLYAST